MDKSITSLKTTFKKTIKGSAKNVSEKTMRHAIPLLTYTITGEIKNSVAEMFSIYIPLKIAFHEIKRPINQNAVGPLIRNDFCTFKDLVN